MGARPNKATTARGRARLRAEAAQAEADTTVYLNLPQDTAVWLSKAAHREGVSKSDFIRDVLEGAMGYRDAVRENVR